jgi:hypothetical protein
LALLRIFLLSAAAGGGRCTFDSKAQDAPCNATNGCNFFIRVPDDPLVWQRGFTKLLGLQASAQECNRVEALTDSLSCLKHLSSQLEAV